MYRPPRPAESVLRASLGLLALGLVCALVYAALWGIDLSGVPGARPWDLIREPEARDAFNSFSEVTVAVLGIAITVVAIIVELAANRYTPRITELFLRDPVNAGVMSGFVVTSVVVVWVNLSLYGPAYPANMAAAATVLMSVSLLAILPYFAYVFDFLSPTRVIRRIQQNGSLAFRRLASARSAHVERPREEVIRAVEQLGDIALNSVDKKDKPLAIAALNALADLARDHVAHTPGLPPSWFDSSPLVHLDQDFVSFHPDIVTALTERRTWVEMKVLRQYQTVFGEALNKMRDVNHFVAIQTRRLARYGLEQEDRHTFVLAVRFLNTYMRAAVNARDVRTAYNLLNEYRLLAEHVLKAGEDELVLEIAEYIKLYGQLAFSAQLGFILESAAYDLCALLELASERRAPCHERLLLLFLDVDREPEGGKIQEESLRGVRKAQIKLATHYLVQGERRQARRIFEDMRGEKPLRLESIRRELEAVEEPEYWEVSDRGINFEWLPPERRATLPEFFGWFDR